MKELARLGLSESPEKSKQPGASGYFEAPPGKTVELNNGETIVLHFLGAYEEDSSGDPSVLVSGTPSRTDRGILAALNVLEGGEANVGNIGRAIRPPYGWIEGQDARLHLYAKALLEHYRPDWQELTEGERADLVVKACEYINAEAEANRKLAQLLEFGVAEKKNRSAAEGAEEDILAAEMFDVEGMKLPAIAEFFGLTKGEWDVIRGTNRAASKKVERGRALLNKALGGRWSEYAARARQALQ